MPEFTLPYPTVTVNHLYTYTGGQVYLSAKGCAWRDEAILAMRQDRAAWNELQLLRRKGRETTSRRSAFHGPTGAWLSVFVVAYMPDRRRRDLDNLLKLTVDVVVGEATIDDADIREIYARKEIDRDKPRLKVYIDPYGVPTSDLAGSGTVAR